MHTYTNVLSCVYLQAYIVHTYMLWSLDSIIPVKTIYRIPGTSKC